MWWECKNCVEGGNGQASFERHKKEHPDHQTIFEFDVEDD